MYEFNGFHIQNHMMEAIKSYVEHGTRPGDFLTAVICNDLSEAMQRADEKNMRNLPAFVAYFYMEVPLAICGTKEKMDFWIKLKQEEREKQNADKERSKDEDAPRSET